MPEVLIASVILTVGLVGMAGLLAVTLRLHELARDSTEATRLAQAKVEDLMKADFGTVPSIQLTQANSLDSNVSNYFDQPAAGFTRRWQVDPGPGANPKLRTVTVRVVTSAAGRAVVPEARLVTILRSW